MKKIKHLFLFGILTLFGIGSSFGYNYVQHFIDFQHNSSNQSYFIQGHGSSPIRHFTSSIDSGNVSPFLRGTSNGISLSLFSLSTNASFNNIKGAGFYYNSNGNKIVALFTGTSPSTYGSYLVPITTPEGLSLSEDLLNNTSLGTYVRVFSTDINCFSTGVFSRTGDFCVPNYFQIFTNNSYTITSQGNVYDATVDGVNYKKGPVGVSLGMGYSFGFVDGNGRQSSGNNHYIDGTFHFKSIMYSGSNLTSLNNVLLYRLNNNTPIDYNSTDNYKVVALALSEVSGYNSLGYPKFPWVYSIYSCPYNSNSIYQCSFVEGGTTNLYFEPGFTSSDIRQNSFFFTSNTGSAKMFNSYNSTNNTLGFYRYYQLPTASSNTGYKIKTFTLDPSAGYNIIDNIPNPDGGNGNQLNRPSYTTGQVSACRNPSYYGVSALGEGFSNPICDEINSLIYVGEDEEGNSIYVYYNDDGSWWVRTMGESNLTSVSAPSGFEIDSSGNVSTIWEVVCTGNFCDDYLSGLKAEDLEQYRYVNIEFGDSIILNTGYYENFFSSLNLTGYVFKCPYTYSNSRFVLGKNIIKKLGGYDPFLPVNCFIAAFENGRRVQFFDDAFGGFNWGPLMDGDTQNHNNLFTFFDILLSIGLIFFLMKFYHLFK